MATPFVPLFTTTGNAAGPVKSECRLKVLSVGTVNTQPIGTTPLSEPALATPSAAATAGGTIDPAAKAPPSVTVQREGDRVSKIQIRCSCGELIELECAY